MTLNHNLPPGCLAKDLEGPEPEKKKCPKCSGYGTTHCQHCDSEIKCPTCDGSGEVEKE